MLKEFILKTAIGIALKRPHPQQFSFGEENDIVYFKLFKDSESSEHYLIDRMRPDGVDVLILPSHGKPPTHKSIEINEALALKPYIEHIYKGIIISYDSPLEFIIKYSIGYARFATSREEIAQWRFNRSAPNLSKSRDILQKLVEIRLSDEAENDFGLPGDEGRETFVLISRVYGDRIYAHPNYKQISANFNLTIEGFLETGEVKAVGDSRYCASGKALQTLANIEETEIRHRDQLSLNRWIVVLTLILAIVGILEIPWILRALELN